MRPLGSCCVAHFSYSIFAGCDMRAYLQFSLFVSCAGYGVRFARFWSGDHVWIFCRRHLVVIPI